MRHEGRPETVRHKADFARLEERVIAMQKTLQGIVRHHALILDDQEARLGDLERRR